MEGSQRDGEGRDRMKLEGSRGSHAGALQATASPAFIPRSNGEAQEGKAGSISEDCCGRAHEAGCLLE